MSDPIEAAAGEAVKLIAARAGVSVDPEQVVMLAKRGAELLVELVDGHAKKAAHQAGVDAASHITTLEEAEQSAKKR